MINMIDYDLKMIAEHKSYIAVDIFVTKFWNLNTKQRVTDTSMNIHVNSPKIIIQKPSIKHRC